MGPQAYLLSLALILALGASSAKSVIHMSAEDNHYKKSDKVEAVTFAFAKHFQDHMVLQKSPQRANIYGFSPTIGQKVTLQLDTVPATHSYNYETTVHQGPAAGVGVWNFVLDPFAPGTVVTIKVTAGGASHTIYDVIFGDVWICSGQSNMEMTVVQIDVAAQEIANAHNYPNIRLMTVNNDDSPTPLSDLKGILEPWTKPNNSTIGHPAWTYFSAVCWLFGKAIHLARKYPIGLVSSDYGGTTINAWSSPQANAYCGVHAQNENQRPDITDNYSGTLSHENRKHLEGPHNSSVLWNAMIHPLLGMTIYGAVWYQGESDSSGSPKAHYNCTFSTMIRDWRANFNKASNGQTSASFPFGFVQLAPYHPSPGPVGGFTDIRWHQTADRGYVPNPDLPNVFMAVAIDLPDFNSTSGPIHPRYKKDIGSRLAISGLAVAYHQAGIFQGPLPTGSHKTAAGLVVDYGNTWHLEVRVSDGFELECASPSRWVHTPIIAHTTTTVTLKYDVCHTGEKVIGLRYAWSESPCALHKCAIYETSKGLPGPPFVSYANYDAYGNIHFTFDEARPI